MRRGFKESSLISTCLGLLSLAFADLGWFVRGVLDFSVIVVPLMIANSVISTVTLGKAIGTVPYADTGEPLTNYATKAVYFELVVNDRNSYIDLFDIYDGVEIKFNFCFLFACSEMSSYFKEHLSAR